MTQLAEFALNLPMAGIGTVATEVPPEMPSYDVTASYTLPPDVATDACSHISVYVDSATMSTYDATNPQACVDLVLSVSIQNPTNQQTSCYKLVKRVAFDKVKLACQVEGTTPSQVIEAVTPEQEARRLAEMQAAQRARVLAGLI
jgi:hypothetical protein